MKLITLIENSMGTNSNLKCEFGFSTYIEDEDISIIFDSGQTGLFTSNIEQLGIDTQKIKNIILSHNHYDHAGGIKEYIKKYGNNFTLTVNLNFFDKRYILTNSVSRILSCNKLRKCAEDNCVNIEFINDHIHKISKNITLFTNFSLITDFENPDPTYFKGEITNLKNDTMSDEIVLGLDTKKGFILLCGCSHIGIVNIIKNIEKWTGKKVDGIIGGLHLSHANQFKIDNTVKFILENNINFLGVSHCTGENVIEKLTFYQCNTLRNNTGNIFIL